MKGKILLCECKGDGVLRHSVARRQNLGWVLLREDGVDLVEVPVKPIILEVVTEEVIRDRDVRREADGILDIEFLFSSRSLSVFRSLR